MTTQSTETMSLPLSSMSALTTFLWVVYGVLQWDIYVTVSTACGVAAGAGVQPMGGGRALQQHHPSLPLPLQVPNALGLVLSSVQLSLFAVYGQGQPRKRVVSIDKPI